MPVTHLLIDSDVLYDGGWPKPSSALQNLFSAAMTVGVEVMLSVLVEWELESKHFREFESKRAAALARLNTLAEHTGAFARPRIEIPTEDQVVADYRRAVDKLKRVWRLVECPNTARPLDELLRMAASHRSPFPDGDHAFRDANILLGFSDRLDQVVQEPTEGMLLSHDGFFQKAHLHDYRTDRGSAIRMMRDIKSVMSVLSEQLSARLKVEYMAEVKQATELVRADEAFPTFIKKNLQVPMGGFLFGPKVIEIRDIRVNGAAVFPPFKPPDDGTVQATIYATVEIDKITEVPVPAAPPLPRTLRMGETPEEPSLTVSLFSTERRREEQTTYHQVQVVANIFLNKGKYTAFEYLSVEFEPGRG